MLRFAQLFFAGILCTFFVEAQITSTFDSDADGWTLVQNGSAAVTHNPSGGNPGGFVTGADLETGFAAPVFWYWEAPAKFRGSKSLSFGLTLSFDLRQNIAGATPNESLVRISDGTTTLFYFPATAPAVAPAWTSYSITLNEVSGGWKTSNSTTGTAATRAQIKQVLGNVTFLRIRGEFNGPGNATPDIGSLDNVVLQSLSTGLAPIVTSFTPNKGPAGTTVTITGSNFAANPTGNVVFFGPVKASITSASPTSLVVQVPLGASYDGITVINTLIGLSGKTTSPFIPTFPDGGRIIPASLANRFDISASIGIEGFAVGDLDGDGWVDFGIANNESNSVDLYRNLGLGGELNASSFAPRTTLATTGGSTNGAGLRFADVDGDGKLDVITSEAPSAFVVFRNSSSPGSYSFEAPKYFPGSSDETPIAFVGDLDGDGRPEMIGGEGSSIGSPNMWIVHNTSTPGNVDFGAAVTYFNATVDAFDGVSGSDLDADGKIDLLVSHGFGDRFSIIKNNSTPGNLALTDIGQIVTGQYNYGLQATDFNGDGLNDIVYKRGTDDIHIRLNTNAGGALSISDFTTDIILASDLGNYGGMNISDFNGDGKPDIIASDDGQVGIFENVYTSGSLTAASFIPAYIFQGAGGSTYPTSPVAADFNRDGKPDIVMGVTNTTPNRISIFQNKNVHTPVISLTTVSPLKGVVGSIVTITGDYFSTVPSENIVKFGGVQATVVTATRNQLTVEVPAGAAYSVVSVTRNELTAGYHLPFNIIFSPGRTLDATSFGAPVNYALTGADFDVDVADLNGDNKIDVVAEGGAGTFIFRNDYTLGPISTTTLSRADTTNTTAQNPRLLDIDGDGKTDLISEQGIYQNITAGAAISFGNLVGSGATGGTDIGDFNLDGKVDFAGVAFGPIEFFENRSRPGAFSTGAFGTVSTAFTIPTGGTGVNTAVADFDNDGLKDIAVAVQSSIDYISFFRNSGMNRLTASTFVSGQNINTLDLPGRVYEADFDVDGKMDILLYYQAGGANPTMFSVFHNQSTGPGNINFVQRDFTIPIVGFACGPSTVSDLDGDGKPEIVITSNSTAAGFVIVKNNTVPGTIGAASFTPSALIGLTGTRSVTAADINSDSKPDLIFTRAPNLMTIMENLVVGVPITITTQPANNSVCPGAAVVLGVAASGEAGLQYQWQQLVGSVFTNISDNATFTGTNASSLTITNPPATATYRIRVIGTFAIAVSANATVTLNTAPAPPTANGNTGCSGTSVSLTASGGSVGQYRWYTSLTGGSAIAGENNASYSTPALSATTPYFVSISNGTCESTRTQAVATITTVPSPTVTAASRCGAGTVNLSAAGGSAGNYRWYDVASGGTAITGAVNNSFTTPSLSATTTYHVSVSNGTCESSRAPVVATVNTPPSKPAITSSVTPSGTLVTICSGSVTLSAPNGFTYLWSTGATTQQITVSSAGTFTVQVIDANTCASVSSDAMQVAIDPATCNKPPVIDPEELTASIEGNVSLDLATIISDPDNNIDLSSITIVTQPQSGATATISNGQLQLDYSGVSFSGTDVVTIRVCDLAGSCTTESLTIQVIGDIEVFNAVSPNGDGLNEFLRIQYIELLARTQKNKVTILNRWGDIVFEVENYDNNTRVFKGLNTSGNELASGTYFYKIEFTGQDAPPMKTGYLTLKR